MVRLPMTRDRDKSRIIGVRHLITVHVITVEVHQMHRPIIPAIVFSPAQLIHQSHSEATHPELTIRYEGHSGNFRPDPWSCLGWGSPREVQSQTLRHHRVAASESS